MSDPVVWIKLAHVVAVLAIIAAVAALVDLLAVP